jgi:hypothetical protein
MELKELFKLKSRFVSRVVGNDLILVPLTGHIAQMSEMFTLNNTARFIWENTSEESTEESMVQLLTDEFDIDADTASGDVKKFLQQIDNLLSKR